MKTFTTFTCDACMNEITVEGDSYQIKRKFSLYYHAGDENVIIPAKIRLLICDNCLYICGEIDSDRKPNHVRTERRNSLFKKIIEALKK